MASQGLAQAVSQHLSSLQQQLDQFPINSKGEPAEESRKRMLKAAKELVATIEKPEEAVMRIVMEGGSQRMSLRVASQLRIFHFLVENESRPVTARELADYSNADELLIQRIMRVITAMGFAAEAGEQAYTANTITKAAATPPLDAAIKVFHDGSATTLMRMNDYFRSHGFACPLDSKNCGFQWAFSTKLSYFEWAHNDPEMMDSFNTLMKVSTRSHWLDWFPVDSELLSGFSGKEGDVLLVDVGGGHGHDVERFLSRYPQSKGHLILQDLPATISSIQELSEGIGRSGHDFFTPQPVKGARAYYLHRVLHDWPDDACQTILCNLKTAMTPGYSKILINDSVLPDRDCPSFAAAGDLNMMAILGGMERTRKQWVRLLESVDLQVVRVWESPSGSDVDGIIEAVLKT